VPAAVPSSFQCVIMMKNYGGHEGCLQPLRVPALTHTGWAGCGCTCTMCRARRPNFCAEGHRAVCLVGRAPFMAKTGAASAAREGARALQCQRLGNVACGTAVRPPPSLEQACSPAHKRTCSNWPLSAGVLRCGSK